MTAETHTEAVRWCAGYVRSAEAGGRDYVTLPVAELKAVLTALSSTEARLKEVEQQNQQHEEGSRMGSRGDPNDSLTAPANEPVVSKERSPLPWVADDGSGDGAVWGVLASDRSMVVLWDFISRPNAEFIVRMVGVNGVSNESSKKE